MWADKATAAVFAAVLERLGAAIAARDLDATLALYAEDEDVTMIGSEAGECAVGAAAVRRLFAGLYQRPTRFVFAWGTPRVVVEGDIAWLSVEAKISLEPGATAIDYRLAAVLARRDGAWRIRLFSGAEPVPPAH
jgi:uncharacterized protein (TIGR02246 family)